MRWVRDTAYQEVTDTQGRFHQRCLLRAARISPDRQACLPWSTGLGRMERGFLVTATQARAQRPVRVGDAEESVRDLLAHDAFVAVETRGVDVVKDAGAVIGAGGG